MSGDSSRSLVVTGVVTLAFLAVTAVYIVDSSLVESGIPLGHNIFHIDDVAPQVWSFFTVDARAPTLHLFVQRGSTWNQLSLAAWETVSFRRISRGQELVAEQIAGSLSAGAWRSCRGAPARCLAADSTAITIVSPSGRAPFCGSLGIVERQTIPWEQRSDAKATSRVVRLLLSC